MPITVLSLDPKKAIPFLTELSLFPVPYPNPFTATNNVEPRNRPFFHYQLHHLPQIYDALNSNGLLPSGITNFTIDPFTGRFDVRLEQPCDTKFESQVCYNFNSSGFLSYGIVGLEIEGSYTDVV